MAKILKAKKKRLQYQWSYKKGTFTDIDKVKKRMAEELDTIYTLKETVYDDGSDSYTLEIHFKPPQK